MNSFHGRIWLGRGFRPAELNLVSGRYALVYGCCRDQNCANEPETKTARTNPRPKLRERTRDQNCANEPETKTARTNPRPKLRERTRDQRHPRRTNPRPKPAANEPEDQNLQGNESRRRLPRWRYRVVKGHLVRSSDRLDGLDGSAGDDTARTKSNSGPARKLRERTQGRYRANESKTASATISGGRGHSWWLIGPIGLIRLIQLIGPIGRRRYCPGRSRFRGRYENCANEPERDSDPGGRGRRFPLRRQILNLLINSLARRITHRLQVSYSGSARFQKIGARIAPDPRASSCGV